MRGRFLVSSNEDPSEGNVYADKSALVLDWLLREGLSKENFSLPEPCVLIQYTAFGYTEMTSRTGFLRRQSPADRRSRRGVIFLQYYPPS